MQSFLEERPGTCPHQATAPHPEVPRAQPLRPIQRPTGPSRPPRRRTTHARRAASAGARVPKYPRKPKAEEDPGQPLYTLGEEIANSVTHGVGCLLAIAGLVLLIVKAALGGGAPEHVASAIVFGVTLILEYLASTLYHAIAVPGAAASSA